MPKWSSFDAAADRRLVHGLNEGDDGALELLYEVYAERLYDYALSTVGDYKAAADIVHDTFIDARRRAPRMRDHLRLRSWLYGAARRRCVQRGRARVLYWEPDADFIEGAPPVDRADEPSARRDPDVELPPSTELRALLESSLSRLEIGDQEALLLAVRHGLRPAEIGIVLGVSPRRAASRVARSRSLLDSAYETELLLAAEQCAAGRPATLIAAGRAGEQSTRGRPDDPQRAHWHCAHWEECADCERRAGVYAAALLTLAPSPVLPAALRHRVIHTATDSELAGYRADIAARGGGLTPDGLPSQPDMPSPFTRRWLLAGGGMAGALATAVLAVFMMGPGLSRPTISWPPFETSPQPSITHESPERNQDPERDGPRPPQAQPPPDAPRTGPPSPHGQDSPAPTSPPPSTPPPKPGTLAVTPPKVELYGTKTADVRLTAQEGPVTWNAVASSAKVSVSRPQGGLDENAETDVTIMLETGLLNLPGEATVTFIDAETGQTREVAVVWGVSIL